jgi:hypothetical protein
VIWVYGICDRPRLPPPGLRGLGGAPLEPLAVSGLLAVFSRHQHGVGDPTRDALWAHEHVVEQLMADGTVLPMRFGSTVGGEEELRRLLAERSGPFSAALARISGRVELSVRALEENPVPTAVIAPSSGHDYLLVRMQDSRRRNRAASALHEPLAALAAEATRRPPRGDDEVLRGAYLVERAGVGSFCSAVRRLQDAHSDLAIVCTGPWPAYSFVS